MRLLLRYCTVNLVFRGKRYLSLNRRLSFKCLDSTLKETVDKRNIGIIAHIDAGKTTVTECLLYLSGLTTTVGDVDHGNTITDYMELERERGITIQSAAVTCAWRKHRINIIDTPGHVDFTLEVERSLRVMDGTVTVLDGSAGVQAQTLTVWRQAEKFGLPSLFFVNKMDKLAASFQKCVESVENRLGHAVVPILVPIYDNNKHFIGVLNLIKRTTLDITNDTAVWMPMELKSREACLYEEHWENLIFKLADVDKEFENHVLCDKNVSSHDILNALRKATFARLLSPIGCGTALRSTESVRPILDMLVDFLPGPGDCIYDLPETDFCALVFKVGHDERHGRLSYTRVYKGTLRDKHTVLNANSGAQETGLRLFTPYSNVLHPIERTEQGDVVVISGLKSTVTGDTLVNGLGTQNNMELRKCVLKSIESPEPVFSCSVEPPNASSIHQFERALAELCVEDPSLRVVHESDTGQTILQGMGELHIEVIKERLKREYGLDVFMGPLRVGYREILTDSVTHSTFIEDEFGDKKQWCAVRLQLDPTKAMQKFNKIHVEIEDEKESSVVRDDWIEHINQGCRVALHNGPLLGFSVNNLMITLRALTTSGNRINSALLSACSSRCVKEALQMAGTQLIEPMMRFELSLLAAGVNALPSRHHYDVVLHELAKRRANVTSIDESGDGHMTLIRATIPLSQTSGIANRIRELTSGLCALHMEMGDYEIVQHNEQCAII